MRRYGKIKVNKKLEVQRMIVHRLNEKVWPFIERHQLIRSHSKVLVAVSGGADSLLLLHYMAFLSEKLALKLHVVTVDHQLRGEESRRDALFVQSLCAKLQIPCTIKRVNVKDRMRQEQESTQIAARKLRYEIWQEMMQKDGYHYLALGHHGDDQLETMLMRLTHFGRPSSFQGIPVKRPFSSGSIIRPLLCLSKDEIYQFCHELEIVPREDPSNLSIDYERNFFRHQILPSIKERNQVAHHLVQSLTERLQEDEEFLQNEAYKLVEASVHKSTKPRSVTLHIPSFQEYAIALQRRAFHLILNYLYTTAPNVITVQHEDDFFSLLHQTKSNAKLHFPSGLEVRKHYESVTFAFRDDDKLALSSKKIQVPGVTELDNGAKIKTEIVTDCIDEASHQMLIPFIEGELSIRGRKAGDRMAIRGLNGHQKLKDLFINEKIPTFKRDNWPLLVDENDQILWVIGLRKADISTGQQTEQYILLTYQE